MGYLQGLIAGFSIVFQPINFAYVFLGVLVGQIIGVLPGIGPIGAMAILLPSIYGVSPVTGIIMLAGIYYGAYYGGSITSILINVPGETASVVTCLDGYQMARQGRAGPALGISAIGSFIGGSFSIICLMFFVFPLAEFAIKFGPPEYFGIMVVGLTLVVYLARGSILKATIMAIIGLILGCVGPDIFTGQFRFTLGINDLKDGVPLVPMLMGLFGVSEVLKNLEELGEVKVFKAAVKNLLPNLHDWKMSIGPIIRGSFLGFCLGIVPGGGAVLSSFVDYTMEKRISKHPENFGKGTIEGVAGPETANNAAVAGAFVPLMAFGLPSNPVMAIIFGGLLIHGVTPGPLFIKNYPEVFWGVIASMYLGNMVLLILNIPLIQIWVKLLRVPYKILFPLILFFCLVGCYSINNSPFDVYTLVFFGVVGYVLGKLKYEFAPWSLAFILGPMFETNFRQGLIVCDGNLLIFLQRPIVASCLGLSIFLLATSSIGFFRKKREKIVEIDN